MQDARGFRLALVVLAISGALLALFQWFDFTAHRSAMMEQADRLELDPESRRLLYRERDENRAKVRLLRQLILRKPKDVDSYLENLQQAETLAKELAPELPAAWEVPWALGASTYLQWSLRRDDRLILQSSAWHAPLERSISLAPGNLEPARFLAAAYLELWPMLAPQRRQTAYDILRETLREPALFESLIEVWLARADNRRQAFEVIPDLPENWRRIERVYADANKWNPYLDAHDRYSTALRTSLEAQLLEAEARRAGGDLRRARGQFLDVASRLRPLDASDDELLTRAITRSPAGVNRVPALAHPLRRLLRLSPLRPLPVAPPVVVRLAGLADEMPAYQIAQALMLGGERAAAERLEDRAGTDAWTTTWAPYWVAKAQLALRRQNFEAARRALDRVAAGWRYRLAYLQTEERWARAVGDAPALAAARQALKAFDHTFWPARSWRQEGEIFLLEWRNDQPIQSLVLTLEPTDERRAAIEVRLDGYILDTVIATSRRRIELTFAEPLRPGEAHLLEVERLAGGGWRPGTVELRPVELHSP